MAAGSRLVVASTFCYDLSLFALANSSDSNMILNLSFQAPSDWHSAEMHSLMIVMLECRLW